MLLVQSRPMVLRLPAHIKTAEYTRFSLELAGVPARDVEAILAITGDAGIQFLPTETKAEIRAARVRGASAMLAVYPASESGEVAYMLDWHEGEFDFRLFGRGPENAVALAESLR